MIKHAICDIDGVLYNGKINEKLINVLMENNIDIIINTGRGYERVKEIFNEKIFKKFYNIMLIENGAKIVNKKGVIIKDYPLNFEVIDILNQVNIEDIIFANYVKQSSNEYVFFKKKVKTYECISDYYKFIKQAYNDHASRVVFNMKENDLIKYSTLFKNNLEVEISDKKYLMISNKRINKNFAINFLIYHEKLNKTEIAVLGNDYNDLSYFKQNDFLKIAVLDENSPKELIDLANYKVKFTECHTIINKIVK